MDQPRSTNGHRLGRGFDVSPQSSAFDRLVEGNRCVDVPSLRSAAGARGIVEPHSKLAAAEAPSTTLPLNCGACAGNCRPTAADWCRCTVCGIEMPIAETAEFIHAK